jgi:nicotinamidase-related amidase
MKAKETAVVLIEFQNEFCNPDGKLFGVVKDEIQRQNTIANAVKLAAEARKKGALIVHVPFVYDDKWVEQKCMRGLISDAGKAGAFKKGSWGGEFIPELQPQQGDLVLQNKRALSSFSHTELEKTLAERGIRHIACAGFLSNVCVEATARSAYDQGFGVTVVSNATAAGSKSTQDYVEKEIYPILGGSMPVDDFLKALD